MLTRKQIRIISDLSVRVRPTLLDALNPWYGELLDEESEVLKETKCYPSSEEAFQAANDLLVDECEQREETQRAQMRADMTAEERQEEWDIEHGDHLADKARL